MPEQGTVPTTGTKLTLVFVGGFPPRGREVLGGQVSACKVLMEHGLAERFDVITVDTSQISNPAPGLVRRALRALPRIVKFLYLLIARRPDAVLIFAGPGASAIEKGLLAWCSRVSGRATVLFLRGGAMMDTAWSGPVTRSVVRQFLRGAHVFPCQGPQWHRFAVDFLGYSPACAPIVPNWTATARLLARGRVRRQSPPNQPINIIFVGWLEFFKGVRELLLACQILAREGVTFTISLVGDGSARPWAEGFIQEERLERVVVIRGWCDPSHIEQLLSDSDIFVLPSWAEGMPNALIEAMAAGVACVTTPVGVIPDYVRDQEHAWLVPPREVKPLADALRTLIREPSRRARIAEGGYLLASQVFSASTATSALCDVVERTVGNVRSSKRPRA